MVVADRLDSNGRIAGYPKSKAENRSSDGLCQDGFVSGRSNKTQVGNGTTQVAYLIFVWTLGALGSAGLTAVGLLLSRPNSGNNLGR